MRIKFWFVTNQNQTKIFASKTFLFVSHWDYITKMLHSKIISQLLTINVTSDTKYFFKKSWVSCSSYLYFLWISSQQTFGIVQLYSLTKNTFWNVFFELLRPTVSTLFLPFFLLTFILCKMDFYHTCPAFFFIPILYLLLTKKAFLAWQSSSDKLMISSFSSFELL